MQKNSRNCSSDTSMPSIHEGDVAFAVTMGISSWIGLSPWQTLGSEKTVDQIYESD